MANQKIFREACLLQLSATCWGADKSLPPTQMEEVGNSEWIKGRKFLINPDQLNPIKAVIGRGRVMLKKHALPFPISGLLLVPKTIITDIQSNLESLRHEYQASVATFVQGYPLARTEAQLALGPLFEETDYPLDIRSRFKFDWRFLTIDFPGKNKILPPHIYEEELRKFRSMVEESRLMAVTALREEFAKTVAHMTGRLSGNADGRPKKIRASMLENLREFLDSFDNRNLFEDDRLADLVNQTRDIIAGINTDHLKDDETLRTQIVHEMGSVETAILESLEDLPRRKLRLAA